MIELRQLEQLVAIRDYSTFSAAANYLCITPPALSISMKKLEEDIQVSLFTRTKNKAQLNEIGLQAAQYAEQILQQQSEMVAKLRSAAAMHEISFGCCAPNAAVRVIPFLNQFFSGSKITYSFDEEKVLLESLINEKYDFVLLSFRPEEGNVITEQILQEHLYYAVPFSHPFARRDAVSLAQINQQDPHILRFQTPGIWKSYYEAQLPDVHFIYADTYDSYKVLAQVSEIPFFSTSLYNYDLTIPKNRSYVPLEGEGAERSYYFVTLKKRQLYYQALCEAFRENIEDNSEGYFDLSL